MSVEDMKNAIVTFVNIAEEECMSKEFEELDRNGVEILKALDELEQYREFKEIFESSFSKEVVKLLSDKKEFASWLERGKWIAKKCEELRVELDRFRAIGTVSDFRELKEKATERCFEEDTLDGYGHTCTNKTCAERIRSKAIEEFAEALRQECLESPYKEVWLHTILKIAKEMKGE